MPFSFMRVVQRAIKTTAGNCDPDAVPRIRRDRLHRTTVVSAATVWMLCATWQAWAGDRAQWGQRWSRNMASSEAGLCEWFKPGDRESGAIDPATTRNVRWVVPLGKRTYTSPVVAGGRVLIGTNNDRPRDPRIETDCGVLMCFEASTGDLYSIGGNEKPGEPYQ